MAVNLNVVALTGNLTADPDLRSLPSGMSVCKLRLAVNGRRKVNDEWVDKAGFFDVIVWGGQGEMAAKYLSKGRPVAISGRLEWREWETDAGKRQAIEIVADSVQFLGDGGGGERSSGNSTPTSAPVPQGTVPGAAQVPMPSTPPVPGMPAPAPVPGVPTGDDDIPF
jgi:single-strand DNA-binding protein